MDYAAPAPPDPPEGAVAARLQAERDAAMHAARLAVSDVTRLTRVLTTLSEPGSLQSLVEATVSTLSELFESDVVLLLMPFDGAYCSILAGIGLPEELSKSPVRAEHGSILSGVLHAGEPTVTTVAAAEGMEPRLVEVGVQTTAWIPVHNTEAAIIGVLMLGRCEPEPFTAPDVSLLSTMARRIGVTVEQAARSYQLEQLTRAAQFIGRHLDERDVLKEAVHRLARTLYVQAASAVLFDQSGSPRTCVHAALSAVEERQSEVWLTETDLVSALEAGSTHYVRSIATAEGSDGELRSMLAVPLTREGQIQGILCAYRRSLTEFHSDSVQITLLYAGLVSAALENAWLYQAARASDDRLRALIRSVSDVITVVGDDGTILYASPAAHHAWGEDGSALQGRSILGLVHPKDRGPAEGLLRRVRTQDGATLTGGVRLRHGARRWRDFEVIMTNQSSDPAVGGIVATYHDVTDRKTFERRLANLAFEDSLTRLPNRRLFMERVATALDEVKDDQSVAVLFVDVDNFKVINDSLGHDSGDAVLAEVAKRLGGCVRREDMVARFGGDEFTVLVEHVEDAQLATTLADRIARSLAAPVHLASQQVFVGASIGIAISAPQDRVEDLIRKADLAMYRAKMAGKGQYALYEPSLSTAAQDRLALEMNLREALEAGELQVFYQPIVLVHSGEIVGVEALARWQTGDGHWVPPTDFIPLAEETGLILPLGRSILNEACRQAAAWQKQQQASAQRFDLHVNVSPKQVLQGTLLQDVGAALESSGLPADSLVLEITETSLMVDVEDALVTMHALRAMGVKLAIDDFGTGYSSLAYLTRLPVDILKIDRSFVAGMEGETQHSSVVRSILALSKSLGLAVTAEGIETASQRDLLRALGCEYGQGYHFARPGPPEVIQPLLLPASS